MHDCNQHYHSFLLPKMVSKRISRNGYGLWYYKLAIDLLLEMPVACMIAIIIMILMDNANQQTLCSAASARPHGHSILSKKWLVKHSQKFELISCIRCSIILLALIIRELFNHFSLALVYHFTRLILRNHSLLLVLGPVVCGRDWSDRKQ